MKCADLHCHSTASDGALTPQQLVLKASEQGIKLLSLTDHDTVDGLVLAAQEAKRQGIEFVTGIEVSCAWQGMTIHILGYDFELNSLPIQKIVSDMHERRWARAAEINRRLESKGILSSLAGAQVIQQDRASSKNAPGRPHFAEYLVQQGYVKDTAEAFHKWLGSGKLGDVKNHWPTLDEVVSALEQGGAKISLAHPCHYKLTRSKRRKLVLDFVAAGGHALEISNGMQPVEQVGSLAVLARELDLMITSGSDFHRETSWSNLGRYQRFPDDLVQLKTQFSCFSSVKA